MASAARSAARRCLRTTDAWETWANARAWATSSEMGADGAFSAPASAVLARRVRRFAAGAASAPSEAAEAALGLRPRRRGRSSAGASAAFFWADAGSTAVGAPPSPAGVPEECFSSRAAGACFGASASGAGATFARSCWGAGDSTAPFMSSVTYLPTFFRWTLSPAMRPLDALRDMPRSGPGPACKYRPSPRQIGKNASALASRMHRQEVITRAKRHICCCGAEICS